jgi:hypothetical protein
MGQFFQDCIKAVLSNKIFSLPYTLTVQGSLVVDTIAQATFIQSNATTATVTLVCQPGVIALQYLLNKLPKYAIFKR